ncbi:class I SAM-dependent methyltransferase [Desulfobacula toluolica]|uniref:Conserved uncharacterized protein n=1 Tax=Desulfobacula toluolica (strain DSM 7467 / Tol2) TaxID=651182 RepID=K0NCK4_DESTT|nr:SAM-dependent methyltransferase [Desulfobacula toluolica]CCK82254.1 conserved uncharacterized protein [Desulfobacula toluolica Tol2]
MITESYYFHFDVVTQILEAIRNDKDNVCLSLDLNLTQKVWQIAQDRLILNNDAQIDTGIETGIETGIDAKQLETVLAFKNKIFIFKNNMLTPVEVRSDGYYKLVPTTSAPTLEINGIKMHRSKDIDPLTDARLKTQLVVAPGDLVLDTCGGLGYSAVFALKAGAKKVISTEKSPAVIKIRNLNPWLKKYADNRLELIHTDISQEIDRFENGQFNSVIHDPPRFTSATGDLYGKKFYDALFRVMASRSKLFHYTGSPKKIKSKKNFIKNTMKRLEQSGFKALFFHENLQGIYAQKR